jgi:flagellar biosynthesis/type III secretory pathway protein FliH
MAILLRRKTINYYDKGHSDGWQEGFDTGTSAALKESKKVFIKVLQKELATGNIDYKHGIEKAIQLIKEHK